MHANGAACLIAMALFGHAASADPIWQNSNYFANTKASASVESPFDFLSDSQGGNYSGLFPPRDDTYSVSLSLPDGDGNAVAASQLRYAFTGNVLSVFGSVSADVDPGDFMIAGKADSVSILTVQFDLPAGGTFRIIDGFFGGTHASSYASLNGSSPNPIFSFDSFGNQPNGESGPLGAGPYTLEIGASANSDFIFFNGLFADASFSLDIEIISGSSCPCDLNGDGFVDDADFSIFVGAYNILDCADPAMPAGCPSDFNGDGLVDDADFVIFVPAYNALICP